MRVPEVVLPEHHGITVAWDAEVPAELRALFRPYAHWLARFAPRWLQCLYVNMHDDSPGASLKVTINQDYNRATLSLYMGWLAQSVPERRSDVAHELVHLYNAPIDTFVHHIRCSEPEALRVLHARLYCQADESATESLAALLVAHLPPVDLSDS